MESQFQKEMKGCVYDEETVHGPVYFLVNTGQKRSSSVLGWRTHDPCSSRPPPVSTGGEVVQEMLCTGNHYAAPSDAKAWKYILKRKKISGCSSSGAHSLRCARSQVLLSQQV